MLSFWHVHAGDYARQATQHPDTEIVAAWDEDPARGQAQADELGVRFHADLDELLAGDDIDGVIVDAPTNIHHQVIPAAAKAGKHIFTEKVLAPTVAEAKDIMAAVDAAGVVLTLSLPRLYDGYTQAIRKVIEGGELGQLVLARARLSHNGAVGDGWLPAHFFDAKQTLGGALIDLGCHPMYLTSLFLGGLPESLTASYGYVTGRAVEDNAVAVLRYGNGALGLVEAGFATGASPFTIELHGTEGSLLYGTPEATLLVRSPAGEGWRELPVPENQPSAYSQWVQHIQQGTKAVDNVAIGLDLTTLMDAANRSASSAAAVTITDL
ncbi:MAG TPA: Gfo/Idh/MocA family oxidoreductase [Mycobacteriales bacterium]|nr:Gfo/Idh/MocA family oxidoreductase [Mycobacteriales bacterium]